MADRGGGVVFVMLPNRNDLQSTEANPPWVPYRTVMRRMAAACNAPLVDLPKAFARDGRNHLFIDEMHPSALGHSLMAETIAATLTQYGWPMKPIVVSSPQLPLSGLTDPFEGKGNQMGLFGG